MNDRWDPHAHRDELRVSVFYTVYHPEQGQLCQGHRELYGTVFVPIQFASREQARKWIQEGCIADLQESLTNLQVGFVLSCFLPRPKRPWEG